MGVTKASVEATTRARLVELAAVDTPQGQLALVLAKRLDDDEESGSSVAALSKELRSLLAALSVTSKPVDDGVDELKKRREQRQAQQRAAAAKRAPRKRAAPQK